MVGTVRVVFQFIYIYIHVERDFTFHSKLGGLHQWPLGCRVAKITSKGRGSDSRRHAEEDHELKRLKIDPYWAPTTF